MAVSFQSLKPRYRQLWDTMTINPSVVDDADRVARKILANKDRYLALERQTGVPWFYIGLVHNRESGMDFNTYLGNGQSLNRVTTIVPKGRGPFSSFEAGAIDAFKVENMIGITDWSLERIAFLLEAFNGFGYLNKGINSPYLWAGTNQYRSGKFVADHVFRADVVDSQLGSMAVLARLAGMDADVKARLGAMAGAVAADSGMLGRGSTGDRVRQLQNALAQAGFDVGDIDGRFGPKTTDAVQAFQRARGLPATGVADQATQAALRVAEHPVVEARPQQSEDFLRDLFGVLLGKARPADTTPAPQPQPHPDPSNVLSLISGTRWGRQAPAAPATPAGAQADAGNVLSSVLGALLGRQPTAVLGAPAGPQADAGNVLPVVLAALMGRAPPAAPGATVAPPKIQSGIDKVLGGEALTGKKTALSVVAYAGLAILKAVGVLGAATPTGQILTLAVTAFGALGGISKVDRVIQALGAIAVKR